MVTTTKPAPFSPTDPFGIDDLLTEEELDIRAAVRHFCDEQITPDVGRWFEDGRGAGLLQVKEFALKVGRIELDECDDLQVRLPPTIQ